jgi:hypothetical protein
VLPLWRKELRIMLCPDKAVVMVLKGALRRQVVSQAILPAIPGNNADWRPAMEALGQWLTGNDLAKTDVKILLSGNFVRFAMMPFSDDVNSRAERLTVAGLLFESIYGETARQWKLALEEEEYGEPCLVAAIDSALWDALFQMISSRQLRVVSVQPYVVFVSNAFNKQIQEGDSLLVIVENQQAVLMEIKDGKISGVRKTALSADSDGPEFVSLLRREMLISGLSEATSKVYLHIAGDPNFKIRADAGMDIITLRDERNAAVSLHAGDPAYEMVCMDEMK